MSDLNKIWNDVFSSQEWGKYPSEHLIRFVAGNYYNFPIRSQINLLELGCGPGGNCWFFAREGFRFTGIDISEVALAKARSRFDSEISDWANRGTLLREDVRCVHFSGEEFDGVIDNECLSCLPFEAAKDVYGRIYKWLKPEGKLFIRTFANGSWGDSIGERVGENYYISNEGPLANKGPCRFTSYESIPTLLSDFNNISVNKISHTLEGQKQIIEWVIVAQK